MTFYHQQILKFKEELYSNEDLYQRVVEAKSFIDKNYFKDIDLNDIARAACFSKYHFLRLFKNIYDKTPNQYLRQLRIEKAKQLLHSGIPVIEICNTVGFDSPSSFTGLFKKMTGFTPTAYQAKQKKSSLISSPAPLKYVPYL